MIVKVALAQTAPKIGEFEVNFSKIFNMCRKARSAGADLVVFPELATVGYLSQGVFWEAPEKSTPYLEQLRLESADLAIVLGTVAEDDLGFLHNAAIVLHKGRILEGRRGNVSVKFYSKLYLPTYGMFEEARWFRRGSGVPVYTLNLRDGLSLKLGVIICEDLWHPLPSRIAALRGAQLICAIASSPKTLTKPSVVDSIIRTRAVENCVYAAFVNAAGSEEMVNFWGGSKLISPDGSVLAEAKLREEDLVLAELDLYWLKRFRQLNPYLRDERVEVLEDFMYALREEGG